MANEILLMADVLSREKSVDKEIIFQAIEAALATATRKRHREDVDARVSIHRDTGKYDTWRRWEVLADDAEVEFPTKQMTLSHARTLKSDIEVGGFIEEPLAPVDFGRIAAQAAKQVIMQKVREAERERLIREYEPKMGQMVSGVVKRLERGDAIVDLPGGEAVLPRSAMIPREGLRIGDRIRAILKDVKPQPRGPQLFLDRVSPELLTQLFRLEVPEAGEGLIEIISAARDPGLRAKIAVKSNDPKVDPVGACVGIKGSRVQSVSNEISGERVDIIKWSPDPAQFVINALAPAEVESIMMDEELRTMDVVVEEAKQSRAIGQKGQNVRLASELTGWEINIVTEEEAAQKAENEQQRLRENFIRDLDVDESVASILVQEGFTTLEEVAYVPRHELLEIEEFDETLVDELRRRAEDTLITRAIAQEEKLKLAQPQPDLLELEGMDEHTARLLASHGVKSRDDLAEYSVDELLDLKIAGIARDQAKDLIMRARAHWFAADEAGASAS